MLANVVGCRKKHRLKVWQVWIHARYMTFRIEISVEQIQGKIVQRHDRSGFLT